MKKNKSYCKTPSEPAPDGAFYCFSANSLESVGLFYQKNIVVTITRAVTAIRAEKIIILPILREFLCFF